MHALRRSILERIHKWINAHHAATIALAIVGLLFAASMVAFITLYQSPKKVIAPKAGVVATPTPTPAPVFYSPLTGEEVPDIASTKQVVTGVMIENSLDARPQSGLKQAGIVFEAIAEGGITRFLALYQEQKPQMIGPVRSLRLYDVDWFAPFQASIAHVGGSLYALREVRNGHYRDIDQFFNSQYYWRSTDRWAPHNVYTSFAKLDQLNKKNGYTKSVFKSWPRTDGDPAKKITAKTIDVTISGPLYNSRYIYNPKTNLYVRYQNGAPHLDREKGKITPSVVIVMDVHEETVLQDGYREVIKTTGIGKAHIFQNGTEIEEYWHKKDRGSQIKFTDAKGEEITFTRGQTWITAVPKNEGGRVTWIAAK